MDNLKLKEALQKQDAYLFTYGNLENIPAGDETFNALSRNVIAAYKECHSSAYIGKLVFSWNEQKAFSSGQGRIYTEFTGQDIPAFGCNFVVPLPDAVLEKMIRKWVIDEWPPDFALFTQILRRIDEVDGITISWK